ncbi:hypothetical protein BC939DRAFT_257691 [Gamsiella multidivaricata]|uniref:uncharacterized protein n=1 Tax=Gamsiella multidivaricata TaxID=101098 RepID=UPI00221EFC2D|nr:uncharacterized protein BC939DRAFT_257691 [Gamsiella multidivaricata]KAI7830652.1 hypothetical protein BC939DRAFT_257691 [Gamsiella multidivaricata]
MSTATSVRATALPSPSIPSPSSIATSSNASTLNTPNSTQTSYEDIDQKIADLRRHWTVGGGHPGPDLMYNCVEYATFNPRAWGFKDRSSQERSPSFGGSLKNEWLVPPTPPVLSGWAAGMQFGHMPGQKTDSRYLSNNNCNNNNNNSNNNNTNNNNNNNNNSSNNNSASNGRGSHSNPASHNSLDPFSHVSALHDRRSFLPSARPTLPLALTCLLLSAIFMTSQRFLQRLHWKRFARASSCWRAFLS